jgi:hypothetical protein
MKSLLRFLLASVIALGCLVAGSQTNPPLSISVRAVQPFYKVGNDVSIEIRLTNNLSHDLNTSANISDLTGVDPNYAFDVRDKSGKPVPLRSYKNREFATGRAIFDVLKSGETVTRIQTISRVFDLSQPGEYTVQVGRRSTDNPKERLMKSNTITVTVTQ